MQTRQLGRTGRQVSVVGLGCWQLGGDWGDVGDSDAMAVLHAAVDAGVTFLDTADVYGDGRSETLIGRLLAERPDAGLTVATKMGRRADPHVPEAVHARGIPGLDRPQPSQPRGGPARPRAAALPADAGLLRRPRLRRPRHPRRRGGHRGIRRLGGDVRRGAHSDRPAQRGDGADHPQRLPAQAARAGAARGRGRRGRDHRARAARERSAVGQVRRDHDLRAGDHRTYNRGGEAFDVGETFAGVPFEVGVRAARRVSRACGAACRPPRWRCGGSSTSQASAR